MKRVCLVLFSLVFSLALSSAHSAQFIDDRVIPPGITRDTEINPTGVANAICITNTPGPTFNIAFCSNVDLTAKTVLYKIPEYTVATLPASHPLAIVTDATSSSTCTAGGGSTKNVCWWNGSAWVSLSGGASGGVPDPGANGIIVRTALGAAIARQLDVVSGQITITNPTGVAGNPTIGTGANVPLTNQSNTFTADQIFNTALVVPRKTTPGDLSLIDDGEIFVDGELFKFKSNTGVLYTLFRITDPVVRVFERTLNPSFSHDDTQGYVVGDMWITTISGVRSIYQAASVATGAADWKCLTCGGSTLGLQAVADIDRAIANAVDLTTSLKVGNGTIYHCFYADSSNVLQQVACDSAGALIAIDKIHKTDLNKVTDFQDSDGTSILKITDTAGAGAITIIYTPSVLTDWDSDADPGDTNDALNQLGARTKALEGAAAPTLTLDDAFGNGKIIGGANSAANAVGIADDDVPTNKARLYWDAAYGFVIDTDPPSNTRMRCDVNLTCGFYDVEGAADILVIDPDAASKNAMYQYGTAYKPLASVAVSLTERGAVTIALESIVSNQPKTYWATVTDANTDALDFNLPITAKMVGITTATVRMVGVSKNAAPSGNIVFTCAITANRPGTDTYAAHSTTGEQTITLTPATQNRPVAATSPAITINGTVVDGGRLWGSCEVDATGTTSAQMTDFRAMADAVVQVSINSLSD